MNSKLSFEDLRGLAGEIFAKVEGGLAAESFHGCQGRHLLHEKAIAIRKEESAPRYKILMQSRVPSSDVVGFARAGNNGLGWRRQCKIKRNEHLGDRCRHAIKSLPACCQDLPGTGLERLVVKHPRESQKVESADRIC